MDVLHLAALAFTGLQFVLGLIGSALAEKPVSPVPAVEEAVQPDQPTESESAESATRLLSTPDSTCPRDPDDAATPTSRQPAPPPK